MRPVIVDHSTVGIKAMSPKDRAAYALALANTFNAVSGAAFEKVENRGDNGRPVLDGMAIPEYMITDHTINQSEQREGSSNYLESAKTKIVSEKTADGAIGEALTESVRNYISQQWKG